MENLERKIKPQKIASEVLQITLMSLVLLWGLDQLLRTERDKAIVADESGPQYREIFNEIPIPIQNAIIQTKVDVIPVVDFDLCSATVIDVKFDQDESEDIYDLTVKHCVIDENGNLRNTDVSIAKNGEGDKATGRIINCAVAKPTDDPGSVDAATLCAIHFQNPPKWLQPLGWERVKLQTPIHVDEEYHVAGYPGATQNVLLKTFFPPFLAPDLHISKGKGSEKWGQVINTLVGTGESGGPILDDENNLVSVVSSVVDGEKNHPELILYGPTINFTAHEVEDFYQTVQELKMLHDDN